MMNIKRKFSLEPSEGNKGLKNSGLLLWLTYLLLGSFTSFGQGENNKWVFGYHNGLDFNINPPTFIETEITSMEGCASVADENGNLLFYSNGHKVWDATNTVMLNGQDLLGNGPAGIGSALKGVTIVKSVIDEHLYYLFTLESHEDMNNGGTGKLRYSVIDMSLNGGMGAVLQAQKNIVLDENMGEAMTIAQGAGCYYWLIAHKNNSAEYRAYKIDANGVHPGVSSFGAAATNLGMELKVSSTSSMIVSTIANAVQIAWEAGYFDKNTGLISNAAIIDPAIGGGIALSPNEHYVYISNGMSVNQYDISMFPNTAAILASRTQLSAPNTFSYSQMRTGPDGKIYISRGYWEGIAVIHNPNLAGTACNFEANEIPILPTWANDPAFPQLFGLGSEVVVIKSGNTVHHHDTIVCTTDSYTISAPDGYETYIWGNGSTERELLLTEGGQYSVTSTNGCSSRTDHFNISLKVQDPSVTLVSDADELCYGVQVKISVEAKPFSSYLWSTGDTSPAITVDKAGTYYVTVDNECGTFKDSVTLKNNCDCDIMQPNAFTPNGDGLNDAFRPASNCPNSIKGVLEIYNRYGQRVYVSYDPISSNGWDGTFNGLACDAGTYFYRMTLHITGKPVYHKSGDITLIR